MGARSYCIHHVESRKTISQQHTWQLTKFIPTLSYHSRQKWWEVSVGCNTSASERSTSSNGGFEEVNNATRTIQPYQYQPLVQGHGAAGASSNAEEEEEEEENEDTFVPDLAHFFGPMLRLVETSWWVPVISVIRRISFKCPKAKQCFFSKNWIDGLLPFF